ncbi:hypothetical protein QFC22_006264 [Naganishia vaughanmartiniae]|uniref:Uncharacterized protein n=1 Tax=Naganishia vaughanmartiniae TaxID=1424756 RepID=A0ACC2WMX3_9TREE|nr:hypothetical protein QFC22_006264 [Naganishia vaughanmartiniae]
MNQTPRAKKDEVSYVKVSSKLKDAFSQKLSKLPKSKRPKDGTTPVLSDNATVHPNTGSELGTDVLRASTSIQR